MPCWRRRCCFLSCSPTCRWRGCWSNRSMTSRTARAPQRPSWASATTPACWPIPPSARPRSTIWSMPWACWCRPWCWRSPSRWRCSARRDFRAVLRTVFFFPVAGAAGRRRPRCSSSSSCRASACSTTTSPRSACSGPNWLGDSDVALWSVIGLTVWKNAGYYMLFYIAGLQNVPRDAIEAAMIDGANAWQRLRFVHPAGAGAHHRLRGRDRPDPAPDQRRPRDRADRGGPSNATNLLLYYIFQSAHENFEYGKAAAATLMSVAVLLGRSRSRARSAIMERGARRDAYVATKRPRRPALLARGSCSAPSAFLWATPVPVDSDRLVPARERGQRRHGLAVARLRADTWRIPQRPR